MPSLALVPLASLRRTWPVVHPMVQAVRERCDAKWLPEDVYAALQGQMALLHLAHDDDGDVCGCLVTQQKEDWGEPHLFVWICFHRNSQRTVADYWPEVQKLAKALNLTRIRCESPREYARVLPMKPVHTLFEGAVE